MLHSYLSSAGSLLRVSEHTGPGIHSAYNSQHCFLVWGNSTVFKGTVGFMVGDVQQIVGSQTILVPVQPCCLYAVCINN